MTTYDTDLDSVAGTAVAVLSDMAGADLETTRDYLAIMCATEPGRMAQVIMALAAWVGTPTTGQLEARAAILADIRRCAA